MISSLVLLTYVKSLLQLCEPPATQATVFVSFLMQTD